jgi:hypothetical protein
MLLGCFAATMPAYAVLESRVSGKAYYDTILNVTWVADANLAKTSGYDADGLMSYTEAQAWIAALNAANYLGVNDWRLPSTAIPDVGCGDQTYFFGYGCVESEMGHLHELNGVTTVTPAPFTNVQFGYYWSATQQPAYQMQYVYSFQVGFQVVDSSPQYAWAVRTGDIQPPDTDGDGIADQYDNCIKVPNPDQLDTDDDGYGNLCDPDLNNDGTVNINDYNRLKARLGIVPVVDVDADLDGNGAVNINDFNRLKSYLGKPPGPSGLNPNCPPTCP